MIKYKIKWGSFKFEFLSTAGNCGSFVQWSVSESSAKTLKLTGSSLKYMRVFPERSETQQEFLDPILTLASVITLLGCGKLG